MTLPQLLQQQRDLVAVYLLEKNEPSNELKWVLKRKYFEDLLAMFQREIVEKVKEEVWRMLHDDRNDDGTDKFLTPNAALTTLISYLDEGLNEQK
jgi:hypothetical protein